MAVKIQILTHANDDDSPEALAAVEMKEMLAESFAKYPNAQGNVYIGYSLTLSGQKSAIWVMTAKATDVEEGLSEQ